MDATTSTTPDRAAERIGQWRGRRVTVMGLGRFGGGVGVVRWLHAQGARVLVTDVESPQNLSASLEQIRDCDVTLRLGEHREPDFRDTDLVIANPIVPDSSPYLAAARGAGVPISTEMNLFVERCRGDCIGVTGSVGKSTTTAMIGHILEHNPAGRRIWVGGNIGKSLLDRLNDIAKGDLVVLELSSFQLHRTPLVRWSPRIAVLTGLTPNHLDWHGDLNRYREAKLNIFRYQDTHTDPAAVLGEPVSRDETVRSTLHRHAHYWTAEARGGMPRIGRLAGDTGRVLDELELGRLPLRIPGVHNVTNAAIAIATAMQVGIGVTDAIAALSSFEALPHRLQAVCVRDGVTYYNDSKSTTPESAITAMDAMETPFCIILGGYDKKSDLDPVAREAARRARFTACIGQTGPKIAAAIRAGGGQAEICESLAEAVEACRIRARPGEAILLSPACASWGMFRDYRERGDAFARIASEMS